MLVCCCPWLFFAFFIQLCLGHIQVGVTAFFVAFKYEEGYAPPLVRLVDLTCNTYTQEQVLDMERVMLSTLCFSLTVKTAFTFLVHFLEATEDKLNEELCMCATYLIELALTDYGMLKYSYEITAAAAVLVAGKCCRHSLANPDPLGEHSGMSEAEVEPSCALALTQSCTRKQSRIGSLHAGSSKRFIGGCVQ